MARQFYRFRASAIAKVRSVITSFLMALRINLIILNSDTYTLISILVMFENLIEIYFQNYYFFGENILHCTLLEKAFINVWKHAFDDELLKWLIVELVFLFFYNKLKIWLYVKKYYTNYTPTLLLFLVNILTGIILHILQINNQCLPIKKKKMYLY